MANENDPKKPAERPKRPNTIDLKATEITPEPVEPAGQPATTANQPSVPETESATRAASQDVSEDAASDASKDAASKDARNEASEGEPPDPAPEAAAPPRDTVSAGRDQSPKDRPWRSIGIAAAAAIVFFAIGLGAGQWLAGRMQPASAPPTLTASPSPELLSRIDKLEAQLASRKEDPQLQARLAKLEAQLGAPRADDKQLLARIVAAEAAVKTLADMTAEREKRSDEIAALAHEARDRASSAATTAEAAQKSQAASPQARADLDALSARIATLEQSARSSQDEVVRRLSADDAKGRSAIAAIALRDAVESGMPFESELAAVKSLSGDAASVAALQPFAASGVPSAEALGRELAGLMPAIWKAARNEAPQTGTFLERLQANAEKIVRIRPAGDVSGDDPSSIRSRIEARAEHADIRGALAELAKLPPDARAPAQAWIAKAQARNAAIAAARNMSQTALGALLKSGS